MMARTLVLGMVLVLLGACAGYPLGMSKEEWHQLSPAQQLEARQQQAELDEQARIRRAEERRREEERRAAAERERQAYVADLYRDARYGDVVQCVLRKPLVDFHPGWTSIEPLAFTLVKREEKTVKLEDPKRGRSTSVWTGFSADGLTVRMCRFGPDKGYGNQCDSLVGTSVNFRSGVSTDIRLPDVLQAGLECAYAPGPGMPKSIILEQR